MKRHLSSCILTILLITLIHPNVLCGQHHHHSHNEANINLIVNKSNLSIDFTIPATILLEFERPAKNLSEKKAIASAITKLESDLAISLHPKKSIFQETPEIKISSNITTCKFNYDENHQHSEFKCISTGSLNHKKKIDRISSSLFVTLPKLEVIQITAIINGDAKQLTLNRNKPTKQKKHKHEHSHI